MADDNTTWDDVLTPAGRQQPKPIPPWNPPDDSAPPAASPAARAIQVASAAPVGRPIPVSPTAQSPASQAAMPQAKRTMGWDDVLSSPTATRQATSSNPEQTKANKAVGWDDLLKPTATTPPTQAQPPAQSKSIFLSPEERTGTHMVADPNDVGAEVRIGNLVPEAAMPAMAWFQKNINDPLNKMGTAAAGAGRELGREMVTGWATPQQVESLPGGQTALGVAGGVGSVVGGTIGDPRNWPFLASGSARPLLQRLISGGFGAQMSQGTIETAKNLYQNWDKLTPEQRSELITSGGISAAMAAGSLGHAVSPVDEHIQTPNAESSLAGVRPTAEIPPAEPVQTTAQASDKNPIQNAGSPKEGATWDDVLGQVERPSTPEQPAIQAQQRGISAEAAPEKKAIGWDDLLSQSGRTEAAAEPQQQGSKMLTNVNSRQPATPISTARQPVALQAQEATPGEYGAESVVKTPTSDIPAKYKLVEASDLQPSHNAETFAPNPNYPPGVQERAYQTSKEAQNRVIQQAQNYDPRYTVNTNPDAVNGPPIVTPDGTVLGGNSRTMSTQRLYARGQGDAYREYLSDNAQQFGIDPEAIDKMQNPVLVREIAAPADVESARRLGSELNKNMTGALGVSERAVSAGKSITPQSLSAISSMLDDLGPDSSIRDLLRERGRDVMSILTRDGAVTERERPQFIDTASGGLSEEGKQFVERALLGTVVDDPTLMERAPKSVLNKLDGSLADISSIAPRTDEYNLLPMVREAIAEHADIAARGSNVETHLAQPAMFGPERNPAVDAIIRKLAEKPKDVREAFRNFAQDANVAKQDQGFLSIMEPPTAVDAFNRAFGAKLTPDEYEQGVLQSLEREAAKGTEYAKAKSRATTEAPQPDARLRSEPTRPAASGPSPRTEPTDAEVEKADRFLFPSEHGAVRGEGSTLAAHTPFSLAKIALDRLNKFYDEKISEPFIQNVLKTGRTHPEVERADPQLAENLRELDNAPKYFRQKAQAIIRDVTNGLSREQERLFTLMADADSRENLRVNHPAEYQRAQKDSAVQVALGKYRPQEKILTEAREAMGGRTLDDDYLRRVYDKYTAGMGQRESAGKPVTGFDRVIRPQKADKLGREAEAEYHYQYGLHEFGPAFGTKYVATMIKALRDRTARDFLSKATALEPGDAMPRQVEYNGKMYYSPDTASDMREAGMRNVETYSTYSPDRYPAKQTEQRNLPFSASRYLGPRTVVDALNGQDAPGASDPSAIKRFFQEQTVGLGFGIPHMGNILRRVTQSASGGAINPVGWVRALKVAFSQELKERGISGVEDPTFDRLARFGAIASDSEVSSFKKYIGGNLNPANWIRPFSKIGHDILFKPGALDQRARLYIGDLIKSQHPEMRDSEIAEAVNEQLGNYNKVNWTKTQAQLSKFMLFPGWDLSSVNWVIRHPVKTSVPPAILVWAANRAINSLGGNRESEKDDFSAIHAGNRAFNLNLLREPLGAAVGGPALRFGRAMVEGKSPTRAVGEASNGLTSDITRPLGMLRPDLGAAIELGTNRQRIGGSQEIYKPGDFATPGHVLPNAGLEKIATHTLSRFLPQAERVGEATGRTGTWDPARFIGGNLGVNNYHVDAEDRLHTKMATASQYEQARVAIMRQNPAALKDLITNDPDAAVYLKFRPYIQGSLGQLRKIDQAKQLVSTSNEAPDKKSAALAALDNARDQEMVKADKVDRAVDLVLAHVHARQGQVAVPQGN